MITREEILVLLANSQAALERAIIVLQGRQTADERVAGATKHVNGRGWSAYDAGYMGQIYDWIMVGTTPKGQNHTNMRGEIKRGYGKALGTTLTAGQAAACRKIVVKYVGQLLEEAQAKATPPVEAPQVSPMLALVVAVVRDHTEGMAPEAIASYLAAHGWRVEQPQEQPQEPAAIAEELKSLPLTRNPNRPPPSLTRQLRKRQPSPPMGQALKTPASSQKERRPCHPFGWQGLHHLIEIELLIA